MQNDKDKFCTQVFGFADKMTTDDRLIIFRDKKDGKIKYESRIVKKGEV